MELELNFVSSTVERVDFSDASGKTPLNHFCLVA